jgi:putative flavoprotein involved in K+ transport
MERTGVVVIGAGHAGLAVSRCLRDASVDHLILERGAVANAWRTERWDSLRLLTPNWMNRLPGGIHEPDDPDGFLPGRQFAESLERYARSVGAPVRTHTAVRYVATVDGGFRVATDQGTVACRAVVVATGAYGTPRVPPIADALPRTVHQLVPTRYRNPAEVPDGPVLVVGASASGVQLAEELLLGGRRVTIAVGAHTRVPRTYRGVDIHRWMERLGLLDERAEDVDDLAKARRSTSLQLVGSPDRRRVDLERLQTLGTELVGRLADVRGDELLFSGGLANVCADADLKMGRLLDRVDRLVGGEPGERPPPVRAGTPRTVASGREFATVIWATGYRAHHPWLEPDLLDERGAIVQCGGVTRRPGIYVVGQPFQRTRRSGFIGGAASDAASVVGDVVAGLAHPGERSDRPR